MRRVTVNFTGEMLAALEELADEQDAPLSQVIRRAIGTEQFLRRAVKDGGRVLVERNGRVREIILR